MSKAGQLSARLEKAGVAEGIEIIQKYNKKALYHDVIDDAMCIMHEDGSVNIIENMGKGVVTVEVISSENILKVLKHYRPFKDVFKNQIQ